MEENNYPFETVGSLPDSRSNLVDKINPELDIQAMEHRLKGEEWDPTKLSWVKVRQPLLNEDGVSVIMSVISMTINLNTTLSNLSEREIQNKTRSLGHLLNKLTVVNKSKWGIKDNSIRSLIVYSVCLFFNHTLKRSLTVQSQKVLTDKELLQNVTHQQTQIVQSEVEKPKKKWGLFR